MEVAGGDGLFFSQTSKQGNSPADFRLKRCFLDNLGHLSSIHQAPICGSLGGGVTGSHARGICAHPETDNYGKRRMNTEKPDSQVRMTTDNYR